MSDPLPILFVAVTTLVGAMLVYSGFRLYKVGLATVGALAGIALGWIVGSHLGSIEVAAGAAILGGVVGAVLAGPLEATIRVVGGGLAAAAVVSVAAGGTGSEGTTAWALTAGAFVVGAVAALILHRPLVVAAFGACGGLLVSAAGLVARNPDLVEPTLGQTADAVTAVMNGELPAVLAIVGACVAAGFLLQAGEDDSTTYGIRPGLRGGGLLLSLLLAGGLVLLLRPMETLPGPALAVTGIGSLSWPLALLLLPVFLTVAHRWSIDAGTLPGWLLGVAFGLAVGLGDWAAAGLLPGEALAGTGYVRAFAEGGRELLLVKGGWTLVGFPLLFSAMVLAPAGRDRGRSRRRDRERDRGSKEE